MTDTAGIDLDEYFARTSLGQWNLLDVHASRGALEDRGFAFERTLRFAGDDPTTESETKTVGDIEIRRTASFEMLNSPKRNYTRLVFIDAVEPKNERMQPAPHQTEPRFPAAIEVSYSVTTFFKPDHAVEKDGEETADITLPITTPPSQVPKVASAGIALSPYVRNERYSATEPRRRFLWRPNRFAPSAPMCRLRSSIRSSRTNRSGCGM